MGLFALLTGHSDEDTAEDINLDELREKSKKALDNQQQAQQRKDRQIDTLSEATTIAHMKTCTNISEHITPDMMARLREKLGIKE